MDASTDATPEFIEEIAGRCTREVVLLRQTRERGRSGLGAAVVQGLRAARAPWVCVMDADLQHPPELIASLLERARVLRPRPRGREPLLRGRPDRLRLGARDGLSLAPRVPRGCCSRGAFETSRTP